jgi:hypothetical protein
MQLGKSPSSIALLCALALTGCAHARGDGTDAESFRAERSREVEVLVAQLAYALELMSQEKVSRILCVNEEGMVEGVISLSDIARLEDGALASGTLRNISDREVRA